MPRCKSCKEKFEPKEFLQKFCKGSIDCLTAEGLYKLDKHKKQKDKEWKIEKKVLKEKLKTKSDYEKELEVIVNKFIRERDKSLPCVSCGASAGTYKLTAGHFYPAGSYRNIRFDEDNIHGQCWFNCNKNRHGNLQEYRVGIVSRITEKGLAELDKRARIPRHYSIPELIELKQVYKEKIRQLKR